MTNLSMTDIVLIIGTVTTSVVTIINAVKGANGRQVLNEKADTAAVKMDEIHKDVKDVKANNA